MRKNYFYLVLAIVCSINVMAQNIPSYMPKEGLVGYWPFNGNANDESGNGKHGTVNGATLTKDRNGVANSAYNFDGDDYIITLSDTSSYSNGITMSAWIDVSANNKNWAQFFVSKDWDQINGHFALGWYNNSIFGDVNNTTSGGIFTPQLIPFGSYINIVYTYDINRQKIYINGNLKNTNNYNSIVNKLISPIYFGRHENTGVTSYFNFGKIDDIAIYNRALSEQEVKQLYAGCTKETATSSNFNTLMYTTNAPVNITATPSGGTFSGEAVTNNAFNPSKAKLGKNTVKYNFKNTTGCADSTNFTMILVDTLGNKCSTYDTLKIKMKLTTGIKAGQQTSMNIYPNPTSDKLIIETNDIQALSGYSYKIIDIQGKEVYNTLATSAKTEISLKSIGAKGMYILHIVDEKGVSIENKKIVLE